MPPHSATLLNPDGPLNDKMLQDIQSEDRFQEKPTSLVEVVKHLPEDVFEKRPFRAYMAALQVRNAIILTSNGSRKQALEHSRLIIIKYIFVGDYVNGCLLLSFIQHRKLPGDYTWMVCCRDVCAWNVCDRT